MSRKFLINKSISRIIVNVFFFCFLVLVRFMVAFAAEYTQPEQANTALDYLQIARERHEQGEPHQALEALKQALKLDRDLADAYNLRAEILIHGNRQYDWIQAEESAKKAIDLQPRNAQYHFTLGKVLEKSGVKMWQLQYALPMGNMQMKKEDVIVPEDIKDIINEVYEVFKNTDMEIQLADCIGYYGMKDYEIRIGKNKNEGYPWYGCTAGKYTFGILHNGDILGCTSVRDQNFIEGNIREIPLKDIWNDENLH